MSGVAPSSRRSLVIAAFAVLSAILGGMWLYRTERQHLREVVENDLQTISQLKTAQIAAWRTERLGDAATLMESPLFVRGAIQWLKNPSPDGREQLAAKFRSLCKHYGYSDILLVDSHGQVRLRLHGEDLPLHPKAMSILNTAMTERRAILSDLHAGGTNRFPHLDVAAPLFADDDPSSKSVGTVILQADAKQFLYPLIQSWPTYSQTAETLLVTKHGDSVLFLNNLRHRPDAALKLELPLTQTDAPAVMAVKGQRGVVRGRDYRGVEVLSALEAIPDSQWFMVAQEDAAEAFAMQNSHPVLIVLLILAVAAIASVSVGIVWQRNQKTHYQSLLKAEQVTRECEDKYRSIFEGSRDAIMTVEPPSWAFTTVNPAAVELFGAENAAQFLACQPWELSPEKQPDGRPSTDKAREMIETAMREGSHFFEWTHKRLTGEEFRATVLLSRVERNGRVFVQATVRDVTETKRIQDELRWKTAFLEAQVNSSLDGILVVDSENKRLLTNSQIVTQCDIPQHILDDPDDAPLLDHVLSLVKDPDEFLKKVKYLYDHPYETGRDEIEFKNGAIFDRYSSPVVDDEGRYYGRVWTFRDITSRRRAEDELAVTAARWDATFNSIADLVSVQDVNHRLIAVNKAYAETFGQTPEAMVGLSCHEVVHRTDAPWPECPCDTVFRTMKPARVEIFEPALGAHLEVCVSPLLDAAGRLTGCVHIAKDISERKRAERKQAELMSQLAAINKELNQFAYVVSHDLKAPLRAIKNLSDWLITDYQDALGGEGRENLHLLGNRVDRMANLIDGVLQYSRAGRAEQTVAPVDLSELVPEIIRSLDAPEHIDIRVDGNLPVIEVNDTRITQVFQNLLSNAIKYMDKPQGEIVLGCVQEDSYWKFSVADNGAGIEEKHFEKIFQLFQTLAPRDTRESTGVGLAIIKKVVEMYGGRIWVESQVGQGSTFYFTLPYALQVSSCLQPEVLSA